MRVALIQVDGKLPNLALMKLSTYHKARGDDVIIYRNPDDYIANMKHGRRIHFAFDHIGDEQIVRSGIEKLLAMGLRGDDLSFYVLTNYNSTHEEDRQRVDILDEYGANPFIMVYDKRKAPEITRRLALWCNKYWSKKACRFEDFDRKAHRQKKRLDYQPGEGAICATS